MIEALAAVAAVTQLLRNVFVVVFVALAAVATADWAVRTRRLNPFGGVARFIRARVDPRLAGVERQVVRAGGHPTATPWWGLVVYVVLAGLVLAALGFVSDLVREAAMAGALGAMGIVVLVVRWTVRFLIVALLVRVLSSWLPSLAASRWTRWSYGATEWMLRPLRGLIPSFGVIDVTPLVAYFALQFVGWLVETILVR